MRASFMSHYSAVLLVSLAAASAQSADPALAPAIGMPGCDTICGNVSVPYPFGIGPNHNCYRPGFNLTCDHGSLLLGDDFEVTHIFLNGTMRVLARDVHAIDMGNSGVVGLARWGGGGLGGNGGPYAFGTLFQNELILTGCNVQARLLGGTNRSSLLGGCSSFCYVSEPGGEHVTGLVIEDRSSICTGIGCCQASVPVGYASYEVRVTRLAGDEAYGVPVHALVAEIGWLTPHRASDLMTATRTIAAAAAPLEVPVILTWSVRHRLEARDPDTTLCMDIGNRDYMCLCMAGYKGNPYLPHGCQDYNECELPAEDIDCFGECTDLPGSYECRCPPGTIGDHTIPGGCLNNTTDAEKQKGKHEVLSVEKRDQVVAATKDLPLLDQAMARMEDKFHNKLSQEEIAEVGEIFKMVIQEILRENSAKLPLSDEVAM